MKNIIRYFLLASTVATLLYIHLTIVRGLKLDRDTYRSNTTTLLDSVEQYKAKSGLNAARAGTLTLRLSEFEKLRAEDAKVIEDLKIKNRSLDQFTSVQTQTIQQLKGVVRDSIVYRDKLILDTLKCIKLNYEYLDLVGCIDNGVFSGSIDIKDHLQILITTKYKRFLGFLWRTKKVKDTRVDVSSKNPNTRIVGVEVINIRK